MRQRYGQTIFLGKYLRFFFPSEKRNEKEKHITESCTIQRNWMENNSSLLNMLLKLATLHEILRHKFQNEHKVRKLSPVNTEIIESLSDDVTAI